MRPNEIAPRVFALLNAAYPVFAFSAAIYSTRDLALNAELFRVLVAINTGGALLYGCALISLFLVPKAVDPNPMVVGNTDIFLWLVVARYLISIT